MVGINQFVQKSLFFNDHPEIAFLVVRFQLLRQFVIAFAIRRVFEQLPEVVAVFFWRINRMVAFQIQQPVIHRIKLNLINHPSGNQQVIAVLETNRAEHGAQPPRAAMDEKQFVGIGVFIKIFAHGLLRGCQAHCHVAVGEQRLARVEKIIRRRYIKANEFQGLHVAFHGNPGRGIFCFQNLFHLRGAVQMVQQRRHTVETDGAEQFLVMQAAAGLCKLRVAFVRQLSELVVDGHGWRRKVRPPNPRRGNKIVSFEKPKPPV